MEVVDEVVGGVDYDVGVKGQRTRTVKMSIKKRSTPHARRGR